MNFSTTTTEHDGWAVVTVTGELDLDTAPELRAALSAVDGTARVRVDLGGVDFIDSTGLGVLIGAVKRARETNSEFELAGVGRGVRIVLEMSGLSALFGL